VSLLGIPHDVNSSFMRGAAEAPALIRQELLSESRHLWTETGRDLGEKGVLRDLGDLRFEHDAPSGTINPADARDHGAGDWTLIEHAVADAIAEGQPLISLGGDHAITHPILRALRRRYPKLTILHFDAHPDIYHDFEGNPRSHASPFARIMEEKLADRLIQVGIRTATAHLREQIAKFGVEVIEARHFRDDVRIEWTTPVYISLDMDGLDPAYAPGVSHREPGGLTTRQVLSVIQSIDQPIVAADVVEYNPRCDIDFMTAPVAAKLVKEIAGMMLETGARTVR
jgi:agmatinase